MKSFSSINGTNTSKIKMKYYFLLWIGWWKEEIFRVVAGIYSSGIGLECVSHGSPLATESPAAGDLVWLEIRAAGLRLDVLLLVTLGMCHCLGRSSGKLEEMQPASQSGCWTWGERLVLILALRSRGVQLSFPKTIRVRPVTMHIFKEGWLRAFEASFWVSLSEEITRV